MRELVNFFLFFTFSKDPGNTTKYQGIRVLFEVGELIELEERWTTKLDTPKEVMIQSTSSASC